MGPQLGTGEPFILEESVESRRKPLEPQISQPGPQALP